MPVSDEEILNDNLYYRQVTRHALRGLTAGSPMNVHNFSDKNSELMEIGRTFLRTSNIPSREQFRERTGKTDGQYVEQYLVKVFDDLRNRLDNGEWDYIGPKDADKANRVEHITFLMNYLNSLEQSYLSSPADVGCEELVWMHDILSEKDKDPKNTGLGSEFNVMFTNLLMNLNAKQKSDGTTLINTSCKEGIQERLIRDAAAISGKLPDVKVLDDSLSAMESYYREYLNGFILEVEGVDQVSVLCVNFAILHLANYIAKKNINAGASAVVNIDSNDISVENVGSEVRVTHRATGLVAQAPSEPEAMQQMKSKLSNYYTIQVHYKRIEEGFHKLLKSYVQSLGMPWICAELEPQYKQQLRTNIIKRIVGYEFFDDWLKNDNDPAEDLRDAQNSVKLLIRRALISRYALQNPPDGSLSTIKKNVNDTLAALRAIGGFSGAVPDDIDEVAVTPELQVAKSIDLKEINKSMCRLALKKAVELWSKDKNTVLSCFDKNDIEDDVYEQIKELIKGNKDMLKYLSVGMIEAIAAKVEEKNEDLGEIFPESQLLIAVLSKNTGLVEKVLNKCKGDDSLMVKVLLFQDEYQCNPLMHAVLNDQGEIVTKILDSVAQNYPDTSNRISDELIIPGDSPSPLWAEPNMALKKLLAHKACSKKVLMAENEENDTILHTAINYRNKELVQAILQNKKCDDKVLNYKDYNGANPLIRAAQVYDREILNAILNSANCTDDVKNEPDKNGWNYLMCAIERQDKDMVKEILMNRCTRNVINFKNKEINIESTVDDIEQREQRAQVCPLTIAVYFNNNEILHALLETNKCDEESLNAGLSLCEHEDVEELIKQKLKDMRASGGPSAAEIVRAQTDKRRESNAIDFGVSSAERRSSLTKNK